MKTRSSRLPAAMLALSLGLGVAVAVQAGHTREDVSGQIVAVNEVAGTITILDDDAERQITLAVSNSTEIEINDITSSLVELGFLIGLEHDVDVEWLPLSGGVRAATAIHAWSDGFNPPDDDTDAEIEGVVIDTTPTTVTVEGSDGEIVTLVVTDDTEVEVEGIDCGGFELISVGDEVEVEYNTQTLIAYEIEVEARVFAAVGFVVDVDVSGTVSPRGTITLRTNAGRLVVVTVVPGTVAVKRKRIIAVGELESRSLVRVRGFRLQGDRLIADRIQWIRAGRR